MYNNSFVISSKTCTSWAKNYQGGFTYFANVDRKSRSVLAANLIDNAERIEINLKSKKTGLFRRFVFNSVLDENTFGQQGFKFINDECKDILIINIKK